jgi:RsiW-degrading membrane proteinase PrsW (M82 family)
MSTLLLPPSSNPRLLCLPLLKPISRKWLIWAPLLALAGGCFGAFGAFITETLRANFLGAFIVAPVVEEALKPSAIYLVLAKWPRVLKNQFHIAALAALGGISFATIENLVYLNIYIKHPSPEVVLWRLTVGTALHAVCSFIFGLGLNQKLISSIKGETKLLSSGKRYFFTAMALHSAYNIAITVLTLVFGWFRVD